MKKTKHLIIGAGLSGITLARYLEKDYLIVEKENEPGGFCRTIRKKDFVWDYAGHFFHFKTDEFKELFKKLMDPKDIIYNEKCTKILYKNKLIDYPFQTNIHQLDKEDFIDCLYDLFNKVEKEEYENFLDMLYGKFGKSIVDIFLKPYNEKLYAIDLKKLDKDAMGRFFPYADKEAIINNMKSDNASTYNDEFMYLKNGAGSYIDVLYDGINQDNVLLNTTVKSINIEEKSALLSNGEEVRYKYLLNTAPLNVFLKLINDKKISELEKSLSYNKVLVFNLGFNKKSENFKKEHWIYLPEKDINFYRMGFYDNIMGTDKLSMYIEIGFGKNDKIYAEKELEKTLQNLKKINVIDDSYILEAHSTIIMDPAYVHINTNTNKEIISLKKKLQENNVYTIGRYGSWTYCSMEDCMVEAKELVEKKIKKGNN